MSQIKAVGSNTYTTIADGIVAAAINNPANLAAQNDVIEIEGISYQLSTLIFGSGAGVIATGTYVPQTSAHQNLASLVMGAANWSRQNDMVTVSGGFIGVKNSVGPLTGFKMTLPIPSAFSNMEQAAGVVNNIEQQGNIVSDPAGILEVIWRSQSGSNDVFTYIYQYQII